MSGTGWASTITRRLSVTASTREVQIRSSVMVLMPDCAAMPLYERLDRPASASTSSVERARSRCASGESSRRAAPSTSPSKPSSATVVDRLGRNSNATSTPRQATAAPTRVARPRPSMKARLAWRVIASPMSAGSWEATTEARPTDSFTASAACGATCSNWAKPGPVSIWDR